MVKSSPHSWQHRAPGPHLGLSLLSRHFRALSFFSFNCFQVPCPISASLIINFDYFLSLSAPWCWVTFLKQLPTLSCSSFSFASPPFALLVCISMALLMVLFGILLAAEQPLSSCECLCSEWVAWGAVWTLPVQVWAQQGHKVPPGSAWRSTSFPWPCSCLCNPEHSCCTAKKRLLLLPLQWGEAGDNNKFFTAGWQRCLGCVFFISSSAPNWRCFKIEWLAVKTCLLQTEKKNAGVSSCKLIALCTQLTATVTLSDW